MKFQIAARGLPSLTALFTIVLASGCAIAGAPATDAAPPPGGVFDPVGFYDVTMSSERMVSEGTMSIRGEPGNYTGMIAVGSVAARIVNVEPGEDHMTVHATTRQTNLILRLGWDGEFLSGNWILGAQRGTFVGRRRPDQRSGGPVSMGTSLRPPHSDQDPS